jgi:hypothetical protein
MQTPQALRAVVGAVGLSLVVVSGFLPWARIGRVDHSGFRLSGELRRFGVDGVAGVVLRLWPFVPVIAAAALVFVLLRRRLAGALFALVVGAAGLSGVLAAQRLPRQRIPDQLLTGPRVAFAGSLLAFAESVLLLVPTRRSRLKDPS